MTAVQVQLLGAPHARIDDETIAFLADKRYQCLGYLAYRGDWVSRDELAYLFWPDVGTGDARQRLRQLVRRIRALPWLVGFETERQRIRWPTHTDSDTLRQLLEQQEYPALVRTHAGDLFEGLDGNDSNEFTRWLEHEREQLRSARRRALLNHARELGDANRFDEAVAVMEALLRHDPLDEEAIRALLRLGLGAGDRRRVLEAYRDFSRHLERELELAPTTETQQLVEALQGAAETSREPTPVAVATAPDAPVLPKPVTTFIGRDLELAEIAHLLSQSDCRLLTLSGIGGVGKSRTALQAAEELSPGYRDGVTFVPLEALQRPEELVPAIAATLKLTLAGQDEPLVQLAQHLVDDHRLLVLDNFEQLIDGAPLVSELLRACPQLDILVASRERLGLEDEWLLPIDGLGYPQGEVGLEDALTFEAVQLFVERARRVRPRFNPERGDLPHLVRICRLVGGSPLGLELAAAWLRAMPVEALADEIERNLGFLESAGKPDRHRSLRATFEHSWKLLTPGEQQALGKFAVFRGGFDKDAAALVAGASIALLAALIDKSLLRVTPEGRYDRHPLVYDFTQEKLAERPVDEAEARARHGHYYHRLLQRERQHLNGPDPHRVLSAIEQEASNVQAAWRWSIEQRETAVLKRSLEPISIFYDDLGRYHEAIELFAQVVAGLADASPEQLAARGYALIYQANFVGRLGLFADAVALAEEGLGYLRSVGNRYSVTLALSRLGIFLVQRGDAKRGLEQLEAALAGARTFEDDDLLAAITGNLSLASRVMGRDDLAESHLRGTLALARKLGDNFKTVTALIHLADIAGERDHAYERAKAYLEEGLELARRAGLRNVLPDLLRSLGYIHRSLGDTDRALEATREGIELAGAMGDLTRLARLEGTLADILGYQGKPEEAMAHYRESLRVARTCQDAEATLVTLLRIADLVTRQGESDRAVQLASLVVAQAGDNAAVRHDAEQQLEQLQPSLSPEAFAEAGRRGEELGLEDTVGALLS